MKYPQMMLPSRDFSLFSRDTAGSAAVEFALTIPVLLLLMFGLFEFGRLLWTQNSIQYAVEQAARCAAFSLTGCTNATETSAFAASQVHGYTVTAAEFTVSYVPCGVTGTTGVLVSASVPFTPLLSSSHFTPFESSLSISLTGQSCRPKYT
jgi:Flp pilus assembly protein TadG